MSRHFTYDESYRPSHKNGAAAASAAYKNIIKDARRMKQGVSLRPAGPRVQEARSEIKDLASPLNRMIQLAERRGDTVRSFDRVSGKTLFSATWSGGEYIFRFPRSHRKSSN